MTTVAGIEQVGSVDGPISTASFNRPWGIAVDQTNGTIYVSDYCGNKIRKISPQGMAVRNCCNANLFLGFVSTVAGSGAASFVEGSGTAAGFKNPWGIDLNANTGDIYVADGGNRRVRKISSGMCHLLM